jgi:hypothetical protein
LLARLSIAMAALVRRPVSGGQRTGVQRDLNQLAKVSQFLSLKAQAIARVTETAQSGIPFLLAFRTEIRHFA